MRTPYLIGSALLALAATVLQPGGAGAAEPDPADDAGRKKIVSTSGDNDNFGYGRGTGAPPCFFFDHRQRGEDDQGTFDYEPQDGSDSDDAWHHSFDLRGRRVVSITFTVWEMFADPGSNANVQLDHVVLDLDEGGLSRGCTAMVEGGVRHTFKITGALAQQIAGDGEAWVYPLENGDDVAFDRAKLEITVA